MGSFGKFLVIVAVGVALWWIWRRVTASGANKVEREPPPAQTPPPFWKRPKVTAQETDTCKLCGAYVTTGVGRCGREACPY
jgi:hypothetical protein